MFLSKWVIFAMETSSSNSVIISYQLKCFKIHFRMIGCHSLTETASINIKQVTCIKLGLLIWIGFIYLLWTTILSSSFYLTLSLSPKGTIIVFIMSHYWHLKNYHSGTGTQLKLTISNFQAKCSSFEKNCCWWLMSRQSEQKSSSEASGYYLSVDDVISLVCWNWLVGFAMMVLAERLA